MCIRLMLRAFALMLLRMLEHIFTEDSQPSALDPNPHTRTPHTLTT